MVGLGSTILIARLLGPAGNGQFVLAMLLPTMLATFLNLGIAPANVYFVGRGDVTVRTAFHATIVLWIILASCGCLAAIGVIELGSTTWFRGLPISLLWIAAAGFPLTLLSGLVVSLLQALEAFRQYNKVMLAAPLVTFVISVITVWVLRLGVTGALIAAVVGSSAGLLSAFIALKPHLLAAQQAIRTYALRCLSYGWKAHLSNILTFFNYRADVLLLNYFLTPAAAGIYMIAVKIAEQLWLLSGAVSIVLLPRLSVLHREEEKRRFLTPFIARWLLIVSICGALILVLIGGPLIRALFGSDYALAAPALTWLLPGIVVSGSARVLANDIAARGRPDINLVVAILVVITNIVGNVLLIPKHGIVGASMATTLSYGLDSVIKLVIYSRMSGNRWFASLLMVPEDWAIARAALRSLIGVGRTV